MAEKKVTCGDCGGRGATSNHVECDGGGFTGSEWAEMDDEFKESYMAGAYDKRCNACNGTGTIMMKVFNECQECGKSLSKAQTQMGAYCSHKCEYENYTCNCGKHGCAWCM